MSGGGELDRFLDRFWNEYDAGALRPIEEYLANHPTIAERVRAEYAAATEGPASGQPAGRSRLRAIGRYVVSGRIQRGGMGLLVQGHDSELGRAVVLKTLRSRHARAAHLERLRQEARIAARLDHECICPVLDVIEQGGRLFLVMPLLDGDDLSAWIERAIAARKGAHAAVPTGPLAAWALAGDVRPALQLLEQVARAVHVAHEAGVVHRDLKPDNIRVRADGTPVVLDFGLALDDGNAPPERLTAEGQVLGSPHYMAPEQAEGRLDRIDRRTDVYALGVILYELLALQPPFSAPTRNQLLERIARGEPTPLQRIDPGVPRDLAAVCSKAMALEPEHRYATARELAEDLERVRTLRAPLARPSTVSQRLWRRVRRNPAASAAVALVLLLAVVSATLWATSRRAETRAAAATAALRILESCRRGEEPNAPDLDALRREFADERAFAAMLRVLRQRDPDAAIDALLQRVNERLRSGGGPSAVRLESPRAAIATTSPRFRFRLLAGRSATTADVAVEAFGAPAVRWTAAVVDGACSVHAPRELALRAGTEYRWSVTLPGDREPEAATMFAVVDPSVRDAAFARHAECPDAAWAALASGAALLAVDLAEDAAHELADPGQGAFGELEPLRRTLLADCYARLGDVERLASLRSQVPAAAR